MDIVTLAAVLILSPIIFLWAFLGLTWPAFTLGASVLIGAFCLSSTHDEKMRREGLR